MQYIFIYIYIYIYISFYIYIYLYISIYLLISLYLYKYIEEEKTQHSVFFCFLLQKNETFWCSFMFFATEQNVLCVFYVLCKRILHSLCSFTFLRKECKRTHLSFGSHKSPKGKILKKECKRKNIVFFKRMQKNNAFRTENNAVPNPGSSRFQLPIIYNLFSAAVLYNVHNIPF